MVNWTPRVREGYRIGVPHAGRWQEVINTDLPQYGGSGVTLGGGVDSEPVAAHGFAQSVSLKLPPLGALILLRKRWAVWAPPRQPKRQPSRPWDERSGNGTNRRFAV